MALPHTPESNPIDYIDEEDFITLEIPHDVDGERLDKILAAALPDYSRNRLKSWVEAGAVTVDGKITKARYLLRGGESIKVFPQEMPEQFAFGPENIPLDVVYEDESLIVVNKPPGLVVHPAAGNWTGTLLNALLFHYPELKNLPRAGIVHRLDKDTSGLLVIARNEVAQTHLVRQLQARTMGRQYLALAHGRMLEQGTVDRPIGRDPKVPVRMSVDSLSAPKSAVTHYQLVRVGEYGGSNISQVTCRLETGRTHQIRAHLTSLGHPLLGDILYGGRAIEGAARQMLHAHHLRFEDPAGAGEIEFTAPAAADMLRVIEHIRWM